MRGLACLLIALLMLAAGCGGDDDEPADTAPTREEFIAEADAFCKDVNTRVADLNAQIEAINAGASSVDEALTQAAPVLADAHEFQVDSLAEFADLTPPAGDEETFDEIVAGLEDQVAIIGELADAAEAGDIDQFQEAGQQIPETRDRVRGLLQDYGFKECGRGQASG